MKPMITVPENLQPHAKRVVEKLSRAGFRAYYAGGCVRDMLLGRAAKDIDIATNARPEEVQATLERASDLQGKVFGVVRVMESGSVFEVATFRTDGPYLDGRHPTSVAFATAEEDAQRRDFTINGLFYDPLKEEVIDFIEGEADLGKKIIRAIGEPQKRFEEDYLRIFRAVRFAAELEFEIEPQTWSALCALAERTRQLAPERVRDELVKCFTGSHPQRAFDLLDKSGLFDLWIPEISKMKGVEQPPQFHPEGDVYVHVRMMMGELKQASVPLAFGALFHDIAKPATFQIDPTGRIRFNEHETIGARMTEKILRRLRFSNEEIEAVSACVANHMAFKDVPKMRLSTLKRFLARPYFEDELELHRIDCLCSSGDLSIHKLLLQKREEFGQEQIKPPLLVTGKDLLELGAPQGKRIGQILRMIEEEQLEEKLTVREAALERARQLVSQFNDVGD